MRFLSAGSLPKSWGGSRAGGVASYHAELLQAVLDAAGTLNTDLMGIFCGTFGDAPAHPKVVNRGLSERDEEILLRDLCADSDAIVLHHVTNRFAFFHERSASETPSVAVVHSLGGLLYGDEIRREEARRRVYSAGVTVVPSNHMLEEGSAAAVLGRAARVLHPPLDPRFQGEAVGGERERIVTFIGTLDENKGAIALVEAMALLPSWKAVLVGQGPFAQTIVTLVEALGLADRVDLVGEVADRSTVRNILDRTSVLCVPSRRESFGIAYIEALARGAAIVGYGPSVAEISEVLEMPCGFACSQDAAHIAAQVEAAHAAGFHRIALASRAQDCFAASRCANSFAEILHGAAGR